MGLWERKDDRVGTYSKGMKQRLALARALLHEPQVLFLDEPTSGLDPAVAREVRDMITQLHRAGRTIFLSTHNLAEAEALADRIAVFRTHLLALDTAANLRQKLFHPQVIITLAEVSGSLVETVAALPYVRQAGRDGNRLTVELTDHDENRPALVKSIVDYGGNILSVDEAKHSLEEIYLRLVQEDDHGP
jgi:ABC-2 type transport system ATP-binding protein